MKFSKESGIPRKLYCDFLQAQLENLKEKWLIFFKFQSTVPSSPFIRTDDKNSFNAVIQSLVPKLHHYFWVSLILVHFSIKY